MKNKGAATPSYGHRCSMKNKGAGTPVYGHRCSMKNKGAWLSIEKSWLLAALDMSDARRRGRQDLPTLPHIPLRNTHCTVVQTATENIYPQNKHKSLTLKDI